MNREAFIQQFQMADGYLDMNRIDQIISECLDRCHDKYPEFERGHMNLITTMEEAAELTEAISLRMRGRVTDNYGVLEEMADVIMAIWCVGQILGISHEDIQKAINVKIDREALRIRDHKAGMETQ